jgi:serine/threonine protein phosphatase PrpC
VRVWLPKVNAPGLAMTRSLCDDVIHTVGVTSIIDFTEHIFDKDRDAVLIVASDGVWDEMTNQEVVDLCVSCKEPDEAVARLIKEARKRALAYDDTSDDVSACVAFLSGNPNSA